MGLSDYLSYGAKSVLRLVAFSSIVVYDPNQMRYVKPPTHEPVVHAAVTYRALQ